jgi:hypothetical protein
MSSTQTKETPMNSKKPDREPLSFKTARKDWVVAEFQKLLQEWRDWQKQVEAIVDQPYDRQRQTEVFADGRDNMDRHSILQAKTQTFLDNYLAGHWFIISLWDNGVDRRDLRLKVRVRHRLLELQEMEASLTYAMVPDAFWKEKAKTLVDNIVKDPYKGIELAEKAIRNPFG